MQLAAVNHHIFRKGSVLMHARDHDVRADIIFSVAAGITSAAAADRFDDHPVTHFEIGNRRAGFLNDAAALMANDAGIGDIGM